jgi:hypothetical protein
MVSLWNIEKEKCVEREKDIALEQYIFYSETADKISDRRTNSNNFFVTLNSTLVTIIGLAIGTNQTVINVKPLLLIVPLVGLLISLLWRIVIQSYRDINTAKFAVLHEIEDRLPLRLYSYEWHVAKHGDGTKYRPTSHIEMWIPVLFSCLYVAIFVVQVYGLF